MAPLTLENRRVSPTSSDGVEIEGNMWSIAQAAGNWNCRAVLGMTEECSDTGISSSSSKSSDTDTEIAEPPQFGRLPRGHI